MQTTLTGRALNAARLCAGQHGIDASSPRILNDLFSVMVHLEPAPVVARVVTHMGKLYRPLRPTVERELNVTSWLAGTGFSCVQPSPLLPMHAHEVDGFTMTFWEYLPPVADGSIPITTCLDMLPHLHDALRPCPVDLPVFMEGHLPRALGFLGEAGEHLSTPERERILASGERLRDLWESPNPAWGPIHGDVHVGNMVQTADGPIWIDFEGVAIGPREYDYACLFDPDLVRGAVDLDWELFDRCVELRTLEVITALVTFVPELGDREGWLDTIQGMTATLPPP